MTGEQVSIRKVYRRADGTLKPGPWHVESQFYGQTWCGVRLRGVQIFRVEGSHPIEADEHLCDACRVAQEKGRPRPWRRR